jgi:hypothetical protein
MAKVFDPSACRLLSAPGATLPGGLLSPFKHAISSFCASREHE